MAMGLLSQPHCVLVLVNVVPLVLAVNQHQYAVVVCSLGEIRLHGFYNRPERDSSIIVPDPFAEGMKCFCVLFCDVVV